MEKLTLHADYIHIEEQHVRECWKRAFCPANMSSAETDDYYVLLRDTGLLESNQAPTRCSDGVAKFILLLAGTVVCLVLAVSWLLSIVERHPIAEIFGGARRRQSSNSVSPLSHLYQCEFSISITYDSA
jgi:hypothetical protein